MHIPITKIKIIPGQRKAVPSHIAELAKSIADVGLLNPIIVKEEPTLCSSETCGKTATHSGSLYQAKSRWKRSIRPSRAIKNISGVQEQSLSEFFRSATDSSKVR